MSSEIVLKKRGRKPLVPRVETTQVQRDVTIDDLHGMVKNSNLPESEKEYIINLSMAIGVKSAELKEAKELLEGYVKRFKQKKAEVMAQLKASPAYKEIERLSNLIAIHEADFADLCTKKLGYAELMNNRIAAGEIVPNTIKQLVGATDDNE